MKKVNIWLNNYYNKYNNLTQKEYNHIDVELFNRIIDEAGDALFIIRGEPTIHPFLWQILDKLEGKNYILSTECVQSKPLINYKKQIPYLSFRYDGFSNDQIRGNKPLSLNMMDILKEFSGRETQLRFEYTISPFNLEYLETDISVMSKFVNQYSRMKEPYFVIYQQSEIYDHQSYSWTPLSKSKIEDLNKKSLLTQRSLKFFMSWLDKKDYKCMSPTEELTIDFEGKVRLCQSLRFNNIIGDLQEESLQDIINNTDELRQQASECPMRNQCWLAYHYKDNVNV